VMLFSTNTFSLTNHLHPFLHLMHQPLILQLPPLSCLFPYLMLLLQTSPSPILLLLLQFLKIFLHWFPAISLSHLLL
jgi:hypothetical protein